jgi:hypothetical protein
MLPKASMRVDMKRLIAALICLVALTMTALPIDAQTRSRRTNSVAAQSRYDDDRNRYERDRSIWDKHRDKITTAGGAAGGAILGGMMGGKKGAIIGAIVGGGGAALYTYKIREKDKWRRR